MISLICGLKKKYLFIYLAVPGFGALDNIGALTLYKNQDLQGKEGHKERRTDMDRRGTAPKVATPGTMDALSALLVAKSGCLCLLESRISTKGWG